MERFNLRKLNNVEDEGQYSQVGLQFQKTWMKMWTLEGLQKVLEF
jgi:hypothetical protein